jgi:hypothetical protein
VTSNGQGRSTRRCWTPTRDRPTRTGHVPPRRHRRHPGGIAGRPGKILVNISRISKDPLSLLSSARALSTEIELDKDLEGYEATKPRQERQ